MSYNRISPLHRYSFLLVLTIGLMIVDHRSTLLNPVREAATVMRIPFEYIIRLPGTISQTLKSYYPDDSLHQKFTELQQNQAVIEARLQRLKTLELENKRLVKLLHSSRNTTNDVLLSEIVDSGLKPFRQKIVINRGIESGVYLGQPAIAPEGVLGQVSETGYLRSVVTLISDSSHGLPVQIQRNGLRTIVHGSGKPNSIKAPYLASQADVQKGDILVTSGMGGRFPVGYQVAEITNIVKDANEAFLTITAQTTAEIGFVKEVLLLWNADQNNHPSALIEEPARE